MHGLYTREVKCVGHCGPERGRLRVQKTLEVVDYARCHLAGTVFGVLL